MSSGTTTKHSHESEELAAELAFGSSSPQSQALSNSNLVGVPNVIVVREAPEIASQLAEQREVRPLVAPQEQVENDLELADIKLEKPSPATAVLLRQQTEEQEHLVLNTQIAVNNNAQSTALENRIENGATLTLELGVNNDLCESPAPRSERKGKTKHFLESSKGTILDRIMNFTAKLLKRLDRGLRMLLGKHKKQSILKQSTDLKSDMAQTTQTPWAKLSVAKRKKQREHELAQALAQNPETTSGS